MTDASAQPSGRQLRHGVTLIDLVMLGAGTAIGAAVFSVLGPAAKVGGAGILFACLLASVPMVIFGLVYAFMASALPRTAASYEWQRQFTHPLIAFAIVWMRVLSNAVVMIVLGRVMINYVGMVVELPATLTVLGLFFLIFVMNFLGVAIAARAQTILMLGLLAVFAVFIASGAPQLKPELFLDALGGGWAPILAALPLMIQLFLGIETATEVGEEVKDAKRVVPWGLALGLALTVVVYLSITFTALSLVGPDQLAASQAPLLDAAKVSLGEWAVPLIVTAAALSLTKSMNAVFLVFSRFLFAMGKAGVLPSALGAIHPKFGTPHIATSVAFIACAAALLLPSDLFYLLIAVSVPTMMKYLGTCLAAFNLVRSHPDVHARARIQFSKTSVMVLAALGVVAAVTIGALGIGTDWTPYALLGAWLMVGLIYYFATGRQRARAAAAGSA